MRKQYDDSIAHFNRLAKEMTAKKNQDEPILIEVDLSEQLQVFGIVQVGLSLKSHDPSQSANGFPTLAGGIIITFTKKIMGTYTLYLTNPSGDNLRLSDKPTELLDSLPSVALSFPVAKQLNDIIAIVRVEQQKMNVSLTGGTL